MVLGRGRPHRDICPAEARDAQGGVGGDIPRARIVCRARREGLSVALDGILADDHDRERSALGRDVATLFLAERDKAQVDAVGRRHAHLRALRPARFLPEGTLQLDLGVQCFDDVATGEVFVLGVAPVRDEPVLPDDDVIERSDRR